MSVYGSNNGETNGRPSMFDGHRPQAFEDNEDNEQHSTLVDLLYDGFYLLFLLHNENLPEDPTSFANAVEDYLAEFEQSARKQGKSPDDIYTAKYALCAAIDETILTKAANIRGTWELSPLQLKLFGDQLAGEHFFDNLEQLRSEGGSRIEALEVYYLCLLLGFKGKFALEASEKLAYLTSRVGDEIANAKGKRAEFAPHWPQPDSIVHTLKREVPVWVVASVCALVALVTMFGLNYSLTHVTHSTLSAYNDVIELPPSRAHLEITLP